METPEFGKSRDERKKVEMGFAHLKVHHHFERIVTRYDKFAANYPAFIKLAFIRIWLRTYEFKTWSGRRFGDRGAIAFTEAIGTAKDI